MIYVDVRNSIFQEASAILQEGIGPFHHERYKGGHGVWI
jgi:hypothetical protein